MGEQVSLCGNRRGRGNRNCVGIDGLSERRGNWAHVRVDVEDHRGARHCLIHGALVHNRAVGDSSTKRKLYDLDGRVKGSYLSYAVFTRLVPKFEVSVKVISCPWSSGNDQDYKQLRHELIPMLTQNLVHLLTSLRARNRGSKVSLLRSRK